VISPAGRAQTRACKQMPGVAVAYASCARAPAARLLAGGGRQDRHTHEGAIWSNVGYEPRRHWVMGHCAGQKMIRTSPPLAPARGCRAMERHIIRASGPGAG